MFHSQLMSLRRQQGSMLVLGIFILTVMFLLAAALIHISENEDAAINQEVLGTRALFAANSGADAALTNLFPVSGAVGVCNANDSWNVPVTAVSLSQCQVTRTCQALSGNGQTQYRITAKAVCGAGEVRVSRSVEVIARDNK